jgi:hypothetical protein
MTGSRAARQHDRERNVSNKALEHCPISRGYCRSMTVHKILGEVA